MDARAHAPELEEADDGEGVEAVAPQHVVLGEPERGPDPPERRGQPPRAERQQASAPAVRRHPPGQVDGRVPGLLLQHGEERQRHQRQPQVDRRRRQQPLGVHAVRRPIRQPQTTTAPFHC